MGVGAMVGTGVFVVWQPAAAAAGSWLLLGLGLAGFVAFCNATSTAQLAAIHPQSGGAYVYGRERLGHRWGVLAGSAFLVGKVASCGAAALAIGTYLAPDAPRGPAVIAVLGVVAVNLAGVTKTVWATRVMLAVALTVLAVAVTAGLLALATDSAAAGGPAVTAGGIAAPAAADPVATAVGVVTSAAVLFYAFAGYARIATLGEEVRDPAVTIPRAVPLALALALALYLTVGGTLLAVLGERRLAGAPRPVVALVEAAGAGWLVPVVVGGAVVSALSALLALVAGVGRTAYAMAADGVLPRWLDHVHPARSVPDRAELVAGAAVLGTVLAGGLVGAVAVSAACILVYYAVANAAALSLSSTQRRWPRWLAWSGLIACGLLALSIPASAR